MNEEFSEKVVKLSQSQGKPVASIGDRLRLFLELRDIKRAVFAEKVDASYETVSAYIQDKAEPSTKFWRAMLGTYPTEDVLWLITGAPSTNIPRPPVEGTAAPSQPAAVVGIPPMRPGQKIKLLLTIEVIDAEGE